MEEIVGARIQDVVRDKLFGLKRLLKECEPEMSLQGSLAFLDATKMILKITEVYYEERVKKIMQISDQSIRAKRLVEMVN